MSALQIEPEADFFKAMNSPFDVIQRTHLDPAPMRALKQAEAALSRSWCPHSHFHVGAALLLGNGGVITGVNYESDSYGLTLCAERCAIARAQAEGVINSIQALFICASRKVDPTNGPPLTPCGACRQWLAELALRLERDVPVYSFREQAPQGIRTSARDLLPGAFSLPQN